MASRRRLAVQLGIAPQIVFQKMAQAALGLIAAAAKSVDGANGMVDFARGDQLRDIACRHIGVQTRGSAPLNGALLARGAHRLQAIVENLLDLRADGVSGVFLLREMAHRHDATGVDCIIGNRELCGNAAVVIARDENRIIVGHHGRGICGQPVESVVGIRSGGAAGETRSRCRALCKRRAVPGTPSSRNV